MGIVVSATGIGSLLAGLVMALWGGLKRRADGMIGFNILMGVSYIIMGLYADPVFLICGSFVYGLSLVFINTHWQSLIQVKVGLELQGRVFAINELLARISIPFGFLLGGILSEKLFEPLMINNTSFSEVAGFFIGTGPGRGIAIVLLIAGVSRAIMGIVGLCIKKFRYMEDILPDISQGTIILKDKDKLQEMADQELKLS